MKILPSGYAWRWPWMSRKAHVFKVQSSRSLCGRWMLTGPGKYITYGDGLPDSHQDEDCVTCWRKAQEVGAANA